MTRAKPSRVADVVRLVPARRRTRAARRSRCAPSARRSRCPPGRARSARTSARRPPWIQLPWSTPKPPSSRWPGRSASSCAAEPVALEAAVAVQVPRSRRDHVRRVDRRPGRSARPRPARGTSPRASRRCRCSLSRAFSSVIHSARGLKSVATTRSQWRAASSACRPWPRADVERRARRDARGVRGGERRRRADADDPVVAARGRCRRRSAGRTTSPMRSCERTRSPSTCVSTRRRRARRRRARAAAARPARASPARRSRTGGRAAPAGRRGRSAM